MIENFSCEYGNLNWGMLNNLECLVTIRLSDFSVRVSACVLGNALLERFIVVERPDDLSPSGMESVDRAKTKNVGLCSQGIITFPS